MILTAILEVDEAGTWQKGKVGQKLCCVQMAWIRHFPELDLDGIHDICEYSAHVSLFVSSKRSRLKLQERYWAEYEELYLEIEWN